MDDKPRKLDLDPHTEEEIEPDEPVKYDVDFIKDLLDALDDLDEHDAIESEWEKVVKKTARLYPEVFLEAYWAVKQKPPAVEEDTPF